ncbi:hypothetical protein EZV62_004554 [Acer yangbiense]|uniref:Leucine-rich repeat-containing N-terminal plant-type domain-containing protein n=1 Tax=Acer yangbiense TaxID=1000413 RepID=A0A5C7IKJ9_9ROSI|nr:hypothetical protein EZV62_004554 [Acer yangbiense]
MRLLGLGADDGQNNASFLKKELSLARHARTSAPLSSLLLLALVSIHLSFVGVVFGASPPSEADGLLKFRDSMNKTSALSGWSASLKICADDVANWNGVLCLKGII